LINKTSCSLCSGAEHLSQVVHGAVPDSFWDSSAPMASSDVAVHILNQLFKKLNEVCLMEDGEVTTRGSRSNVLLFMSNIVMLSNLTFAIPINSRRNHIICC
jgi:hypothetical protein